MREKVKVLQGELRALISDALAKQTLLPYEELDRLIFGQQHYGTQQFFIDNYGQYHTISLSQFPHYLLLKSHLKNPYLDNIYHRYLIDSWEYLFGKNNTEEHRMEKIKAFINLYHSIEKRKKLSKKAIKIPLTITTRPDGRQIIISGNHRAAIALKLRLDVRCKWINPKNYLRGVVCVPDEFYGSAHLKMPYQSIYYGGEELVKGRRRDTLERFKMIEKQDIKKKTILDIGCNIGASCFLAHTLGMRYAIGVDYSPKIISAAIRLNSYFAAPCKFIVHDLNVKQLQVEPVDTVFCFSIINHVKNKSALVETICEKTKRTLYFEGHAGTSQKDYDYLLNKKNFSSIELLGHLKDGIHTTRVSRPFFRCEVN